MTADNVHEETSNEEDEEEEEDEQLDMAEEDAICRWVLDSMEAEKAKGHIPASAPASIPTNTIVTSASEAPAASPATTQAASSPAARTPVPPVAAVAAAQPAPAAAVQTHAASAKTKGKPKIGSAQRRKMAKGERFCQAAVNIWQCDCQGHVVKSQHHHMHSLL